MLQIEKKCLVHKLYNLSATMKPQPFTTVDVVGAINNTKPSKANIHNEFLICRLEASLYPMNEKY